MELQHALIIASVVIVLVVALVDGARRAAAKNAARQQEDDLKGVNKDEYFDDGVGEVRILTQKQEPKLDESSLFNQSSGHVQPSILSPKEPELPAAPDLVVALNVIADDDNEFNGPVLFQQIVAMNLKFSDMGIFHRYEQIQGHSQIQFSLANAIKPGTFDVNNIASFYTPGVCLFLTVPGPSNPLESFDYMLEAAQSIARAFKGTVLDGQRNLLSASKIKEYRQQLQKYTHA